MTPAVTDPGLFADAQSLANLKREAGAHDPQALRSAAQQFESLFLDMMLKSARAANFKDPLFGSTQQRFYQGLYDQQLASDLSKTHAFGLAEMLVQQLRKQWAAQGTSRASSTTGAAGTASTAAPIKTATSTPVQRTPSATSAATPSAVSAATHTHHTTVSAVQQSAFAQSLWPDATRAGQRLGVSPVSLIAQAALETDWGQHMPRSANGTSSNNLFGIKTGSGWSGSSASSLTQEYHNGTASTVKARFRAYQNCAQCFHDYTTLLSTNPRYARALGTGNDVGAFASALQQAGYATDPNYASKLTAVADTLRHSLAAQSGSTALKVASNVPITSGSTAL